MVQLPKTNPPHAIDLHLYFNINIGAEPGTSARVMKTSPSGPVTRAGFRMSLPPQLANSSKKGRNALRGPHQE
jgi:hypothetical protein